MAADRTTRRESLIRAGALLGAAIAAGGWERLSVGDRSAEAASGSGPAGVASGAVSCVLSPEMTEGPYYIAGERLRRNITEGKPGVPLWLRLGVVDVSTCKPIKGAAVDVWHADAAGVYSGFGRGAGNRTFLRGIQRSDARGIAQFRSIYPGWYPGRTVHIHVEVHVGGNVVHTGQLFFAETVTDAVYRKAPYSSRGARDTRNADDAIFANGGKRSMLKLRKTHAGYIGRITMGIHRS
jgi:protocatechuate 3,4-dioxygenase beta subunit